MLKWVPLVLRWKPLKTKGEVKSRHSGIKRAKPKRGSDFELPKDSTSQGDLLMRFRVLLFAVTCLALAFSATAFADPFDWQTRPILGTDVTYTGDVVVNTGPIPITIPHYSMLLESTDM